MLILGIFLILIAFGFAIYWATGNHPHKAWVVPLCISIVLVGVFFTTHDRAIELTFIGIGKIKTAANQATTDAKAIAEIRERIESQSATVDLVAKSAAETENKLIELDLIAEFYKVVINAQNDDRRAFDKLVSWLDDKSFSLRKETANAVIQIRADFGGPLEKGYMNISWPENIDPSKLSISDLRKIYRSVDSIYHAYLVNFINKKSDISKKDRMAFFIDVIKEDESLIATSYAGKFFAKDADIEWKHFVIQPLLEWWEENKDTIE